MTNYPYSYQFMYFVVFHLSLNLKAHDTSAIFCSTSS